MSEGDASFQKSKRLLRPQQYRVVLRQGKKIFNPLFLLFVLHNNQAQSRLGITVSRKVSKRAVDRNRIKRQVREFFRLNQDARAHCDVVMIAKPTAAQVDNAGMRRALKKVWQKAGQYINS